ncbi:unnamed protein product [Gongylonema pulchrum]|uniref:Peroxin-13 n=1 Tax=Gongylonema pulchrum TaxID=637853 RepID=A0A183EKC4_9BILA|nr:unnamed protein product [Gongylonema pulchrum]
MGPSSWEKRQEKRRPGAGIFESIEEVVEAVNSVTILLNSAHHAFYSSFRAVISAVAEFSRLKAQVRHCLFEHCQQPLTQALPPLAQTEANSFRPLFSWVLWLSVIIGSYFALRLLARAVAHLEECLRWSDGEGEYYEAVAVQDYTAAGEGRISFKRNEVLRVAPKRYQPQCRGYLLARQYD